MDIQAFAKGLVKLNKEEAITFALEFIYSEELEEDTSNDLTREIEKSGGLLLSLLIKVYLSIDFFTTFETEETRQSFQACFFILREYALQASDLTTLEIISEISEDFFEILFCFEYEPEEIH